ncbi:MAG: hypothetical protein ACYCZB_12525 [Acidiphilium sp.]
MTISELNRKALSISGFVMAAALAACAAPSPRYVAPPGLTAQSGALLVGSLTKTTAPMLSNATVEAGMIDGARVTTKWSKPILLAPGPHTIEFGPCLCRSAFLTPPQRIDDNGREFQRGPHLHHARHHSAKLLRLVAGAGLDSDRRRQARQPDGNIADLTFIDSSLHSHPRHRQIATTLQPRRRPFQPDRTQPIA